MKDLLVQFHRDEAGATATEYIILLVVIACLILITVKGFGAMIKDKYSRASMYVQDHVRYSEGRA